MSSPDAPFEAADYLQDPAFIADLRRRMLKFAHLQLGDSHLAEDVVQEALVSALKNVAGYRGQAAFKTWMFGILKHKIIDALRQRRRWVEPSRVSDDEAGGDEWLDQLFDETGHWRAEELPRKWGDPEGSFQDDQFWQIFAVCLDGLPPRQGRAFMMREFLGLDADEMCKVLGISQTNLHVTLHRARLRLRECLENRWFGEAQPC